MIDRRSFLRGLVGLAAAPIIVPKRTWFFFGDTYKPAISLQELHKLIGRATVGNKKPGIILMRPDQFKWLEEYFYPNGFGSAVSGFHDIRFTGISVRNIADGTESIVGHAHAMNQVRRIHGLEPIYDDFKPAPWGILRADKHFA